MKDILKMIEEVSPNDTTKLGEIDAKVWEYVTGRKSTLRHKGSVSSPDGYWHSDDGATIDCLPPQYTRSRDTLKDIRPHGWVTMLVEFDNGGGFILGWNCCLKNIQDKLVTSRPGTLPTEELAELHAIIQAIEYERSK